MTKSDDANERLHGYLVLASMKEPVLDDIRFLFKKFNTYDDALESGIEKALKLVIVHKHD